LLAPRGERKNLKMHCVGGEASPVHGGRESRALKFVGKGRRKQIDFWGKKRGKAISQEQ